MRDLIYHREANFNALLSQYRSYLLPPTPSSDPASPAISDQESVSDEEQSNNKQAAVEEEKEDEIKKSERILFWEVRVIIEGLGA